MTRKELMIISKKIDLKTFSEMKFDQKIEYVKNLFELEYLSLNSIIKSMVETNFPTLKSNRTIESYVVWYLDVIIDILDNIDMDGGCFGTYRSRKKVIDTFLKNAKGGNLLC